MKRNTSSIYLYDIAGAFIATFFFAPIVSVVWNSIVIAIFLAAIKSLHKVRFLWGIIVISIGGAILDFIAYIMPVQSYVNHTYEKQHAAYFAIHGVGPDSITYFPNFGLYFMVLPIIAIGAFNYVVGGWVFHLKRVQSVWMGIIMGILTAPWIVYWLSYGPEYH